jgi:hypothetical protein
MPARKGTQNKRAVGELPASREYLISRNGLLNRTKAPVSTFGQAGVSPHFLFIHHPQRVALFPWHLQPPPLWAQQEFPDRPFAGLFLFPALPATHRRYAE